MTSQPPAPFENYPPAPEDGSFAFPDPEPVDQSARSLSVPARVGTRPTSRRGLLRMLGAGAGAVVLIGLGASAMNRQGEDGDDPDGDEEGWTGEEAQPGPAPDPDTLRVGDYSTTLPPGWIPISERGDEATVAKDGSTVRAWSFTSSDADQANTLVTPLVLARCGAFTGALSSVVNVSDNQVQRAVVTASGYVGRKRANLSGQLWIDARHRALLVVEVLLAHADRTTVDEADAIVSELSGTF